MDDNGQLAAEDEQLTERERMLFEHPEDRPRDGASLLRRRSGRLPLETFAPLFVELLGVIKADATGLCQQESGVLLDNVDPGLAEQVAAALRQRDEDCLVIPAAEVTVLPRPQPVHALRFTKSGLAFGDATGHATPLAWEELTALAVAHVAVEETKRKSTGSVLTRNLGAAGAFGGVTGVALAGGFSAGAGTKLVKSSATHQFLDLVAADGPLYFRVDARQFDYRVLGNQLQPGSLANLLTLTRWLLTYAPGLLTNLDAEELKRTGTTHLANHTVHGLTEVSQWLLNLARLGQAPLPPRE